MQQHNPNARVFRERRCDEGRCAGLPGALVWQVLEHTHSVTETARILGVPQPRVSVFLNRKTRKKRWIKLKLAWAKASRGATERAKRARTAARALAVWGGEPGAGPGPGAGPDLAPDAPR